MKGAALIALFLCVVPGAPVFARSSGAPAKRLYWFIPDGMRADPVQFDVFRWAREGKLPNIKKMMDEGAHGYSIPDFPSHTPINFASLLTGAHPSVHGIADGPMHVEGAPLDKPSASGFVSTTKRVPAIWSILDAEGKKVVLLSIPGSTPPEIRKTVIRGRWGGWGADTWNMVFESRGKLAERKSMGRAFRLFFLGKPLTQFAETRGGPDGSLEATLEAHGLALNAAVNRTRDRMSFSIAGKGRVAELGEGQWSGWIPVELSFKGDAFDSQVRIKVIRLWPDGNFRVRVLYDNLNRLITEPGEVADMLTRGVGPMVDHADNWPPQLIFEKQDKQAFLDEMRMSLDWHKRAVPFIFDRLRPDVFIQDTYTPNQMLESRWWQGEVDATREGYSEERAAAAWKDILEMYRGLDAIMGEAMKKAGKDTVVALSSDHGVCPLHRLVHLNNLFARKGWLTFTVDPVTGEPAIDWKNTKVVYLKMLHVYVNPNGLAGNWTRASGPEYEKLRREAGAAIAELTDENGVRPLVRATAWEDAKQAYDLPQDRIGDLVLETRVNYFWYEEPDRTGQIFSTPLTSGYKQSLDPRINACMWTPFVVWGPGVKKGVELAKPISHADQLPTFLTLLGVDIPAYVQGRVISEALK